MRRPKKLSTYWPAKKKTARIKTIYIQAFRAWSRRRAGESSAVRVRKTGMAPNGFTTENNAEKVASNISMQEFKFPERYLFNVNQALRKCKVSVNIEIRN